MHRRPTVLLGMSGGVDSSVAALLLVNQGYAVHGVTLQVWEHEDEAVAASKRWQERGCCKVGIARFVAQRLGISHDVIDTRESFKRHVIDDFVGAYLEGTTPNPCVRCNERVKLKSLIDIADKRGFDYVATGHYAQIVREPKGLALHCAVDHRKDQSYFLYRMDPTWLPRILFPLGERLKADVWKEAEKLDLPAEELKESQEICFVSHGDYRTFLLQQAPGIQKPGKMIDQEGRILGDHAGIAFYTPGQRRGLGVATGERLYVQRLEAQRNLVVLGTERDLYSDECEVADLNLLDPDLMGKVAGADVKYRYATAPSYAQLAPHGGNFLRVRFDQPQRALTPGQSAVFYQGTRVLGGGIIR
ncbi:tRNA-specific 2-thiouridylase MnmA 1 [Nitrospira sp.]|nr:tRNA-specific 2-thiouridylase MnmA 1 [Nitrospira sp.]